MDKNDIISQAKSFLEQNGFSDSDYVVSLQGPTIILTEEGQKKMTEDIEGGLEEIGIELMGGSNQSNESIKEFKHIKVYEQFVDTEEEEVATEIGYSIESEEFMTMKSNQEADYSVVFDNAEGEYVTLEVTRALEEISDEGTAKMGVIEGTATDGKEYEAIGKYDKKEDPLFGETWHLKSIIITEV